MPIDDHTLLLNLERAYEILEDRVKEVEGSEPEVEDICDCDCHESDFDRLEDDIRVQHEEIRGLKDDLGELRTALQELTDLFTEHMELHR